MSTNPVKEKILAIVASMEIVEQEKETQKAIIDSLKKEYNYSPKNIRKNASLIYKNKTQEYKTENTELMGLIDLCS